MKSRSLLKQLFITHKFYYITKRNYLIFMQNISRRFSQIFSQISRIFFSKPSSAKICAAICENLRELLLLPVLMFPVFTGRKLNFAYFIPPIMQFPLIMYDNLVYRQKNELQRLNRDPKSSKLYPPLNARETYCCTRKAIYLYICSFYKAYYGTSQGKTLSENQ